MIVRSKGRETETFNEMAGAGKNVPNGASTKEALREFDRQGDSDRFGVSFHPISDGSFALLDTTSQSPLTT